MDVGRYSTGAEYMVDLFAEAFGAHMVTFSAPMLVDRPEILESLLSDSRIAAALKIAQKTNIAIFGVGDVSKSSSPFKVGYYNQKLLESAQRDGAVGEICGRFYDASGQPCSPKLDQRTLAIELENLKQKAMSIAVSSSTHKVEAILGMLRGQYCNVLITDEETAKALLSKSRYKAEMPGGEKES
jgi:deoxyribonucleoside regulator